MPHHKLSSKLWENEKLKKAVKQKLIDISDAFIEYIGIPVYVDDVVITGSYSNYNYTKFSDIDLHVMVDLDKYNADDDIIEEFFNAKKSFWNDKRNIKVNGIEVELYPQDITEDHTSTGVYSIYKDKWIVTPKKFKNNIDIDSLYKKSKKIEKEILLTIKESQEKESKVPIEKLLNKIKKMRKSGLEKAGEMADENIIYKILRDRGYVQKLFDIKNLIIDKNLSL